MEKNDRQNKNKGVESYMIRQKMSMTGYIKEIVGREIEK